MPTDLPTPPTATLTPAGTVVLLDQDGEENHCLSPGQALALSEWLLDNRDALEQANTARRTVTAYRDVADLVHAGLPAPDVRTGWDGRLELTFHTNQLAFTAWSDRLVENGATVDTRLHPNLGSRSVIETETLRVEGPWSVDTAPVSA